MYHKEKQFLFDFGLYNEKSIANNIKRKPDFYTQVKRYNGEGDKHYNCKKTIFQALYDYMKDDPKFFICNELLQIDRPYLLEIFGSKKYYYRLDVCCVCFTNPRKPLNIDIEVDGWEHFTKKGKIKGEIRDELMKDNYNSIIIRVDYDDWDLKKVMKRVLNEYLLYVITCNKTDYKSSQS
jgi:hypothetical protein